MEKSPSKGKKKGGLKVVLIIIAILVVGTIAIGSLTLYLGYKTFSAPADASQEWLELIREGNVDQAYDATSFEFQQVVTREDMTGFLAAYPVLANNTSATFSSFNIENDVAVISGSIRGAGEESPVTVTLVRQDGEWKVVEISLNPEDVPESSNF